MKLLSLLPTIVIAIGDVLPEPTEPPKHYEFMAFVVGYFDSAGKQVGLDVSKNNGLSTVPERLPAVGEIVPTIDGGFRVMGVLGTGTDSTVYLGEDINDSKFQVALKFQMYADWSSGNSVESEFRVLSILKEFGTRFPAVYLLSNLGAILRNGEIFNLRYMVMELLGSSIWSLTKLHKFSLPMKTIASVALQSIESLEKMHSTGYIHGDIHLENILFAHGPTDSDGHVFTNRVMFGDYGKSTPFLDVNRDHIRDVDIEYSDERNLLYLSPFELAMGTPSRREDIYRLMETLARMLGERVYGDHYKHLQNNREALLLAKKTTPLKNIFPSVDQNFVDMFNYSRSLSFDEQPDYNIMKLAFNKILTNLGINYSGKIILP